MNLFWWLLKPAALISNRYRCRSRLTDTSLSFLQSSLDCGMGWQKCKYYFCCCCYPHSNHHYKMRTQLFGKMPFSAPVQLYEIENKNGMVLSVINYGARIVGLKVPSLTGKVVDVVCGFKTLEGLFRVWHSVDQDRSTIIILLCILAASVMH